MSKTIGELKIEVDGLKTDFQVLARQIGDAYDSMNMDSTTKNRMRSEIRDMKMLETSYNKEFEEEYRLYGGKTRRQTLQEFVFLFFYVACGITIIALTIYKFSSSEGSGKAAAKIFFLGLFILLLITGILIRYA
jgi:hypothetical protein